MIAVERFMNVLEGYINACVQDVVKPDINTKMQRSTSKQIVINELRLLLQSAQEERSPSPYHRASDWRR